jgi:twitching motility protein PilJ
MTNKSDTSSTFRMVAIIAALALIVAAGLSFLQDQDGKPGIAELAVLSQALPARANAALAGSDEAFGKLEAAARRVSQLRGGAEVPGARADWQALESAAAAVAAARESVVTGSAAACTIAASASRIVAASNVLLDRSGAVAEMQEFQQRAGRMGRAAAGFSTGADIAAVANGLADDAAFLRETVAALSGGESQLDISALRGEDRQQVLEPIANDIEAVNVAVAAIGDNAAQLSEIAEQQAALATAAETLAGAFAVGQDAARLPTILQTAWIPIGLIAAALVLVLALIGINAKSSRFEHTAREQGQQNERNQQAILRLLDEMGSLADGDLTVEATVTEDITGTIADSFNYAIEELRKLVATVNETAIMVESAAKQTESSAGHMATAAENQGREINAATESVVSMASSLEEVSGNAERSSDVARHSVEVAHKGGEAVRRTIDGMNAIRETIQDTSKRIKRLGESSQEIGNIVELINDIAEQTNILALNASIQASMAGEAGRGFAVVADEVQRLAERSTNATRQIEVLVRTIQSDTNEAVVSMERSTTDVVGGALLAENAGAALDEIEQVSNQIASLVQNISGSARQQAGSAADVTRRTRRLREISEETGKATTATADSIAKLSELASQLRESVAGFTLPGEALRGRTLASTSAKTTAQQAGDQETID